jgi:hypothetical protein
VPCDRVGPAAGRKPNHQAYDRGLRLRDRMAQQEAQARKNLLHDNDRPKGQPSRSIAVL